MNKLTDKNYLIELCGRFGFRFTKSLGQNFLVSQSVLDRIADTCATDAETGVLEIGPGVGTLSAALAERSGSVVSVEIDKTLIPILEETLGGFSNVKVINCDALKLDLQELCKTELLQERRIVCANLPYYITAQATEMVLSSRLFSGITLMLQYEAARRICACPGDDQYCALAAIADFYSERSIPFLVPANCFYPRPGVGSAVLKLDIREELPYADDKLVLRIINGSFAQRRKTLANSLSNSGFCTRDEAEQALAKCGYPINARAETLSGTDFARLASIFANIRENG